MRWVRSSWVDIVWAVFVVVNLLGMREMGAWSTVPFLVIWVSLTLVYGWRMWRLQPALLTVGGGGAGAGGVSVGTGGRRTAGSRLPGRGPAGRAHVPGDGLARAPTAGRAP